MEQSSNSNWKEHMPLNEWINLCKEVTSKSSSTVAELSKLVWQSVLVKNEGEENNVWEIKEGILKDMYDHTKNTNPNLALDIEKMSKELLRLHKIDSAFMQGFLSMKNGDSFINEFIWDKNPPSPEKLKLFFEALSNQKSRDELSSSLSKLLIKKISNIVETINQESNITGKYIASRKLNFLKEFQNKWCTGNNVDGTSIFSIGDIFELKLHINALDGFIKLSNETGNTEVPISTLENSNENIYKLLRSAKNEDNKLAHIFIDMFQQVTKDGKIKVKDMVSILEGLEKIQIS